MINFDSTTSVGRICSAERRVWEVFDTMSWQPFLLESVHNDCVTTTPCPIPIIKLTFSAGNGRDRNLGRTRLWHLSILERSGGKYMVSFFPKPASLQICLIWGMVPSLPTLLPYWVSSLCPPGSAILNLFYHFHQHCHHLSWVSVLIFFCVDSCHRSYHHKFYPFNPFSTILSNANLIPSLYCFKFLKRFPIKDYFPTKTYETLHESDLINLPDSPLSLPPSYISYVPSTPNYTTFCSPDMPASLSPMLLALPFSLPVIVIPRYLSQLLQV